MGRLIAAVEICHLVLWQTPYFWFVYPLAAFVIASRQGALLNIVHEASHYLVCRDRKWNDIVGKWLCATPIGVDFDGFRRGHKVHHLHAGTPMDPPSDTEKYKVVRLSSPKLWLLFLKDLSGITALSIFFAYKSGGAAKEASDDKKTGPVAKLAALSAVQLVLLGALFQFDIAHYLLLWIVPAISPHMFLMRIRGIAEHGLPLQIGAPVGSGREGSTLTRSFLTPARRYGLAFLLNPLEKLLIGSIGIHYHHEHHALPGVPYYHLPKVHAVTSKQLSEKNPELYDLVYERGYFSAFLAGLTRHSGR